MATTTHKNHRMAGLGIDLAHCIGQIVPVPRQQPGVLTSSHSPVVNIAQAWMRASFGCERTSSAGSAFSQLATGTTVGVY